MKHHFGDVMVPGLLGGRLSLRPNVHTIHPKFYVILVNFNTI